MQHTALLQIDQAQWILTSADQPPLELTGSEEDRREAVLEALSHRSHRLVITLASNLCLAATFSPTAHDRKPADQHQANLYEFERYVPYPVEALSTQLHHSDTHVFATAIIADQLANLAKALLEAGHTIAAITPGVMLTLQSIDVADGIVLIEDDDSVDVIALKDSKPFAWQWSTLDPVQLNRTFASVQPYVDAGSDLHLCSTHDELEPLAKNNAPSRAVITHDADQTATHTRHMAEQIAQGNIAPLIDYRQGSLAIARKNDGVNEPLQSLQLIVIVCLIALAAALWWRTHQYHQLTESNRAQQRIYFAETHPDKPFPVSIQSRLQSELAQLSTNPQTGHSPDQLLRLMHDTFSSLPATPGTVSGMTTGLPAFDPQDFRKTNSAGSGGRG